MKLTSFHFLFNDEALGSFKKVLEKKSIKPKQIKQREMEFFVP